MSRAVMSSISSLIFLMGPELLAQGLSPEGRAALREGTAAVLAYDLSPDEEGPEPFARERSLIARGSGAWVSPSGWLATNYHVISDESGLPYPVIVIAAPADDMEEPELFCVADLDNSVFAPEMDLALLRCLWDRDGKAAATEGYPALPLAGPEPQELGEALFLAGFPEIDLADEENPTPLVRLSVTSGIVSAWLTESWLLSDAKAQPGSSGGPAVDAHGRLVGIVTGSLSIGFTAIRPVEEVRALLEEATEEPTCEGGRNEPALAVRAENPAQ